MKDFALMVWYSWTEKFQIVAWNHKLNSDTIYIYAFEVQFDVEKEKNKPTEQLEFSSLEPEKVIPRKDEVVQTLTVGTVKVELQLLQLDLQLQQVRDLK